MCAGCTCLKYLAVSEPRRPQRPVRDVSIAPRASGGLLPQSGEREDGEYAEHCVFASTSIRRRLGAHNRRRAASSGAGAGTPPSAFIHPPRSPRSRVLSRQAARQGAGQDRAPVREGECMLLAQTRADGGRGGKFSERGTGRVGAQLTAAARAPAERADLQTSCPRNDFAFWRYFQAEANGSSGRKVAADGRASLVLRLLSASPGPLGGREIDNGASERPVCLLRPRPTYRRACVEGKGGEGRDGEMGLGGWLDRAQKEECTQQHGGCVPVPVPAVSASACPARIPSLLRHTSPTTRTSSLLLSGPAKEAAMRHSPPRRHAAALCMSPAVTVIARP